MSDHHDPAVDHPGVAAAADDPGEPAPIVDWGRTARRMRTSLLVIGALVLAGWGVGGALGDGWSGRLLAELVGFGIFAAFAVEVVVVGGSAARGLLRAGERGDRLASADVSILPPQLTRRRRG
ncbi:hypothetical protein FTX61_12340 [Nitriliruptoraceae bacterium ZYF776]|nr:hypothetical protein [Profundirhabdus halotolerans]